MSIKRHKRNFTAGELSPILDARVDNERYKNGCSVMLNMYARTQGPVTRRSGFQFIYDLTTLLDGVVGPDKPRMVPFVFDEEDAYVLVFFPHSSGTTRVVFATDEGLVVDPVSPSDPYTFEFTGVFDIDAFKYAQSADTLFITQPDRPQIEFRRLAHDEWEANEIIFTDRPWMLNTDAYLTLQPSATTGVITVTASKDFFTASFVGTNIQMNGGEVTIDSIVSALVADATVVTTLTSTTAESDWSTPDWGPVNGYPENVGFFEQRICYAGTLTRPQTLWFSKSGDYYDFGVSSPIIASDAATFTLDSGTQNKIQWLSSARQLLVGTLGDEWAVSGSGYEPLSFQSIRAARHTNNGSEALQPLMIGPVTLFLERLGRTVNQLVYDYNSDSYTTVDLSVLSPHLTEFFTLVDWDYQQTPNGIVWGVRDDGVLLGLTFKREHKVTGWHRHTTQGEFLRVACIPGNREDELWTITQREVEGVDKWYIEKKAPEFQSDDSRDGRFLDSFLTYDGVATDTITGLDHLEGFTVSVLADGAVHPDVVVSGGSVALNREVDNAVVGLSFPTEVRPLSIDLDMQDGTSMGRMQRVTQVVIQLYRSLGMEIGRDDSEDGLHMEEVPFRVPGDLTGNPVPIFSGQKKINFPEGFDRETSIVIQQNQPLPLTILGIVDYVEVRD